MKKTLNSLFLLLKLAIPLVCLVFFVVHVLLLDIPDLGLLNDKNPKMTSFMLEDVGPKSHEIQKIHFTPLHKISPHMIRAILTAEDDLFFVHHGFNWKELMNAFKINFQELCFVRGGSTITQQLARNLFLTRDKSIFRKLREWLITIQLEYTLTKKRILELYLNSAEFGPGIYGIAQASQYHCKTKPSRLTSSQSALLAAVLPSPKKYGKKPYPRITYIRQKKILSRQNRYDLHLPKDLFK